MRKLISAAAKTVSRAERKAEIACNSLKQLWVVRYLRDLTLVR